MDPLAELQTRATITSKWSRRSMGSIHFPLHNLLIHKRFPNFATRSEKVPQKEREAARSVTW